MATKKYDKNAKCPYYRKDVDIRLVCAGIAEDMQSVNLVFRDRESLLKYRRTHCNRNCDSCFMKEVLDKKFEPGENNGI